MPGVAVYVEIVLEQGSQSFLLVFQFELLVGIGEGKIQPGFSLPVGGEFQTVAIPLLSVTKHKPGLLRVGA